MTTNENAPVILKKQILINQKSDKVWKVLTDINQWKNWNSKITVSKIQSPLSLGNLFNWKVNGTNIQSKIILLESNKSFGWTGKTFGAKAIHLWYLEETEKGTLVKVEESMEGFIIYLFKKRMNKVLEQDMTFWLECLKDECEK